MIKFHLTSYDGMKFEIYEYGDEFILIKSDPKKLAEQINNPGVQAHEYFQYKNLQQILEQLKLYDESQIKKYWEPILDSVSERFQSNTYDENWHSFLPINYQLSDSDSYKYITYVNESIKPKMISPFNTLHQISPINKMELTEVSKFYMEIYPISCKDKNESYFVKILSNNEEILKEYISFKVNKKKGMILFLRNLFKEVGDQSL
jgi:hypothetical protein